MSICEVGVEVATCSLKRTWRQLLMTVIETTSFDLELVGNRLNHSGSKYSNLLALSTICITHCLSASAPCYLSPIGVL